MTSLPVSYRISLRHWLSIKHPAVTAMLRAEMAHIRPDVVHAHNIHMYLTYDALRVARAFTPKVFLTTHDVMSFAFGRLNTLRYLASNGKDASLGMADHMRSAGLQYNPLRNRMIRRILRKNTARVFAVSAALKHALDAHRIPRVDVVHNGLDLAQWTVMKADADAVRERYGLRDKKVIFFGGRLSADKGVREVLQALSVVRRTVPNAMLLVIGEERRWNPLFAASGLERELKDHVRCTGWIARTGMPALYAAADVVTLPSLCLDCLPTMALEAGAAAKPVVGSPYGGIPAIVRDGDTGTIVDPRKTDAYANALIRLLQDDALARKMGEAGRRRVEEIFTLERQAEEYLRWFGLSP